MAETARVRHPVVIAGGGPTGMMLAAELAIAGSAAVVVEPRPNQDLDGSRAGGLHARTIEVLDQRGVAERFLQAGQVMQVQAFAMIPLDISDFPTRHNYGLALWQSQFEQILAGWTAELGVQVIRGRKVTGFTQSADAVVVELDHGELIECSYLVGCDGGHSTVRESAGIGFEGLDASTSWMIAEVEMGGDPVFGMHRDASGNHGLSRRAQGEPIRVVITEPQLRTGRPSLEELRSALHEVFGTDYGLSRAHWISRFTDASRQASEYRAGRVLLAGDAAHVHPPQGGQGLNTGVQDAVNLGWKLAGVLRGDSGEGLLDTYHAERHPVGARVQRNTMAQVVLGRSGERHRALHAP
ncbi:MAG: FAD-dependent monooxygenase [Microthrixaceae bacterium]